jgi:cyanophycinase-like exopeptidase
MSGAIGLHGGGEYLAGDEPFLDALLVAAARAVAERAAGRTTTDSGSAENDVEGHAFAASGGEPDGSAMPAIRIVVVPTAAARGMPDRTAETGVRAFERRAAAIGLAAVVEVARVVDGESASDPELVDRIASADLVHLPGGDPDLVPTILRDTPALEAMHRAWRRGGVLAGASAGAMALADWTWTPHGGMRGLGFVHGLAVVPHYDEVRRTRWQASIDLLAPGGIGYLGLDERTGVLAEPDGAERSWVVAGPGAAWWFARGSDSPLVAHDGERLRLPA